MDSQVNDRVSRVTNCLNTYASFMFLFAYRFRTMAARSKWTMEGQFSLA